jgi:hypothetical protein
MEAVAIVHAFDSNQHLNDTPECRKATLPQSRTGVLLSCSIRDYTAGIDLTRLLRLESQRLWTSAMETGVPAPQKTASTGYAFVKQDNGMYKISRRNDKAIKAHESSKLPRFNADQRGCQGNKDIG